MSSVWFLLVDSNGQPYKKTSADKVKLPTASDIADFRKAIKTENSQKLSSFDASDLVVYKNKESFDKRDSEVEQERKEPLEVDSVVDGLGTTMNEALIVVVEAYEVTIQGSPTSLNSNQALEKFSELVGVDITDDDEVVLIKNFPEYFRLLKLGKLNTIGAKHLYRLIKTTMKSLTIQSVRINKGYVFGKSIATGGGKSILQKVFSLKTGTEFCAKVFLNVGSSFVAHSAVFEYELCQTIGPHENIVRIVDSIQFSHESGSKEPLMALMMPLYNWSLAELLVCFHEEPLPLDFFQQVTLGLLAAGAIFQAKSFSHCDIKPDNIMMNGFIPVVVDFGAVVPLGNCTVEHTPFYALDADHKVVTPEFDLFCIVTTLVRCFAPMIELQKRTKADMILLINDVSSDIKLNAYGNICLEILQSTSSQEALDRIQNLFSRTISNRIS